MKQEKVMQSLSATAAQAVLTQSPEEFAGFVRGEHARWAKIIRDSGLATK
jgi:hypothetical protein